MTKQTLAKYHQESKKSAPDLKHADRGIRTVTEQNKVNTVLTLPCKYGPISR